MKQSTPALRCVPSLSLSLSLSPAHSILSQKFCSRSRSFSLFLVLSSSPHVSLSLQLFPSYFSISQLHLSPFAQIHHHPVGSFYPLELMTSKVSLVRDNWKCMQKEKANEREREREPDSFRLFWISGHPRKKMTKVEICSKRETKSNPDIH